MSEWESVKARLETLAADLYPIDAADIRAALEEIERLRAALREWREAESSPDCVACCTLDAALCPEVKP